MTETTHQQFQALLQAAADKPLTPEQRTDLDAHLAECEACRAYAARLAQLETDLRQIARQQRKVRDRPYSIQAIKGRSYGIVLRNKMAGMAANLVVPALALAFVMAINLAGPLQTPTSTAGISLQTPGTASQTPTPPIHVTTTELLARACDKLHYTVRDDDTLDRIAAAYGVPKEALLIENNLASDSLEVGTELVIPQCSQTPASTTMTPSTTITIIPLDGSLSPPAHE